LSTFTSQLFHLLLTDSQHFPPFSPVSKSPVPVWILAYGGIGIVIGLATYGYKIMSVLGNRITLHSPSRGFSMEFGAALTVILATRLALPVSTTQSISGATVAVGLCNGDRRSINWKMVLWICFGWVITIPITGVGAGLIFAIITNSPRFGFKSTPATAP
jgi:sodium-dependent phosphate transporter